MSYEHIHIDFDGEEATDLYDHIVQLEVELDEAQPATFVLILAMGRQDDGSWRFLDDERVRIWTPIIIKGGYVDVGMELLLDGYVTEVRPRFDASISQCTLELHGMDRSILMDRTEVLKAWPEKKDSDIASEILSSYGFNPTVKDTAVVHEEALSTVIQRETDLQFLQRLGLRNGFVCVVDGEEAYFGPVPVDETPQPVLAAHFGPETNLNTFSVMADALHPAGVSMYQVDRFNKEVLSVAVESSDDEALGSLTPDALLPAGTDPAQVIVARNAATGQPEMEALCEGLFREGTWFVEGEGEILGNLYAHVLRPRRFVTIKGVGETYSGVYYVSYVRHQFTPDGYWQYFKVRRDGLELTGREDFSSGGGLFDLL